MTVTSRVLGLQTLFLLLCGSNLSVLVIEACESGRLFVGSVGEDFPGLIPLNGVYFLHDTDRQGLPVFKHQSQDLYLYHLRGNLLGPEQHPGFWAVGDHVGGTDALISVPSNRLHPADIGYYWRVWNAQARKWQADKRLRARCVPESFRSCGGGDIVVSGLEADHENQVGRLGVYQLTNDTSQLRPVYKHRDSDQYLFFNGGLWLIGPTIGTSSGGMFVPDNAWRPEFIIQDWVVFTGWLLDDDPTIRVTCYEGSNETDVDNVIVPIPANTDVPTDVIAGMAPGLGGVSVTCPPGYCHNQGVCTVSDTGETNCSCSPGSYGDRCENVVSCEPIRSRRALGTTGVNFLDVAFVSCGQITDRIGDLGDIIGVVCQANGRWSATPRCHPGIHHVTPELEAGPVFHDLPGARRRAKFRIGDLRRRLPTDRT